MKNPGTFGTGLCSVQTCGLVGGWVGWSLVGWVKAEQTRRSPVEVARQFPGRPRGQQTDGDGNEPPVSSFKSGPRSWSSHYTGLFTCKHACMSATNVRIHTHGPSVDETPLSMEIVLFSVLRLSILGCVRSLVRDLGLPEVVVVAVCTGS